MFDIEELGFFVWILNAMRNSETKVKKPPIGEDGYIILFVNL